MAAQRQRGSCLEGSGVGEGRKNLADSGNIRRQPLRERIPQGGVVHCVVTVGGSLCTIRHRSPSCSERSRVKEDGLVGGVEPAVADHIDVNAEKILKILDQLGLVENRRIMGKRHEQVDVASCRILTTSDGPDDTNIPGAVATREPQDGMAVTGQHRRRTQPTRVTCLSRRHVERHAPMIVASALTTGESSTGDGSADPSRPTRTPWRNA